MERVSHDKKHSHPFGFHVCCLTFMFERLAYYGAKSILLLYLITAVTQGGLGIDATEATVITANLIAYTAIAPIIGGIISDRWIGARYSVSLGLLLMAIGYIIGWGAEGITMIHGMIILVSLGTGLFKGNLNALIGCQYEDGKELDEAFSIQYSYINIGTFAGSLITGYLYLHVFCQGDVLGFKQCFLVAAAFCAMGTIWFTMNWKNLQGHGVKPYIFLEEERRSLTKNEKKNVLSIVIVAILSVIFWLFYFQQDLALVIYMTDYVDMEIGTFSIPTTWITTSWNGLLCIILGGIMARIWKKLGSRPQGDANLFCKIGWSFMFLAGAYGVMVLCELLRNTQGSASSKVSFLWPLCFVTCSTIGEMCFSPLRNAFVSKYAPKKYLSLLMGVIASSSFFANKLSPYVQVVILELNVYTVFASIFVILILVSAVLMAINKRIFCLVSDNTVWNINVRQEKIDEEI